MKAFKILPGGFDSILFIRKNVQMKNQFLLNYAASIKQFSTDNQKKTKKSMLIAAMLLGMMLALWGCASPKLKSEFVPRYADMPPVIRGHSTDASITVTKSDMMRPYIILGEISVSINRSGNKINEAMNAAIVAKAKEVDADAVILLKTDTSLVGVSTYTTPVYRDAWGNQGGGQTFASNDEETVWRGTAIRFKD